VEERHGAWGSLAVARGAHDRATVTETADGAVSVLVGEPLVTAPGVSAGLAWRDGRRDALHRLLAGPAETAWDAHLDGMFAALRVEADGGGLLASDLFGFVPLFEAADGDGALVLGTHGDAVAVAAGRAGDVDAASVADLLLHLTVTHPYTAYAGVRQLLPGTARRFGPEGWRGPQQVYWRPEERTAFRSPDEAAEALRDALTADLRAATEGCAEVGLLLSGGEDSRAVLGAMPAPERVRAFAYGEWENREVSIARRVAAAYGARFDFGRRSATHYADGFADVASFVGSTHLFADVHGFRLHERLGLASLPVVVGGLSSDSLLKGIYRPGDDGVREDRTYRAEPAAGIRPALVDEVSERRTAFLRRLAEIRPDSAGEWMRLWPFSMRKHGANVHGNRRLFAAHEAYHANAVLAVAAGVPHAWKRDRRLFRAAVRPFLRRSWYVPHTNARFPYFGPLGNALLVPGLAIGRGALALARGQVRARHQPWPKWSKLAAQVADGPVAAAHPLADSPIGGVFAGSGGAVEAAVRRDLPPLGQLLARQLAYVTARAAGAS
jgi:hypothetical protein